MLEVQTLHWKKLRFLINQVNPLFTFYSFPSLSSKMSSHSFIRWMGFDLDHCIGQVIPIHYFAASFDPSLVAQTLCHYEMCGETNLLRPGFTEVIAAVANAFKELKISGAFLYSNNKKDTTVEFAKELMNAIAHEVAGVKPFKAAFHRLHASRSSESDKNFHDICNMLHCSDFVPPASPRDIAFFDDKVHPLITETPYYYQVTRYDYWTPVGKIITALEPLKLVDADAFSKAANASFVYQDSKNVFLSALPTHEAGVIEKFLNGIAQFLENAPPVPVIFD